MVKGATDRTEVEVASNVVPEKADDGKGFTVDSRHYRNKGDV